MKTLFIMAALAALPYASAHAGKTDVQVRQVAVQQWEPAEEDQLRIKLLSYQYLQAKESQDYEAAFAAFSDTTAAAIDFKSWKANQRKFKAAAGAEVSSLFTRVTWYDNPSNAPLSGIFAAVDYSSVYANISIHCGYLMWHKKDDGSFELIREEQNHIDNATQKKLSAGEIADIKAKFGCKAP
jgi:hypothetical protein